MVQPQGFDWIWDHIPGLSWYQVFVVTIAGYVGTIGGFTAVYPNFAQYDTPGRCATPLDGDSYSHLNLTFDQIVNITKTKVSGTTCQYVKTDYSDCKQSTDSYGFMTCALALPILNSNTTGKIVNCTKDDVIYDTRQFTSTIKSEFKLSCGDGMKNSLATSLSFIGLFVGAGLAGFCSDKFGRKITITISVFFNALFWLLQAYVPGYTAFVVIRILVQAANQAAYLTYVCYSCEVVGPNGRKTTGMIPNFTFTLGYVFDSLLSYLLPDWREFTLVLSILTFPFILLWPLWPKSPRWLFSVGRAEEGQEVVKLFAKRTKTDLSKFESDNAGAALGEAEFYKELIYHTSSAHVAKENATETDELLEASPTQCQRTYSIFSLFTSGTWLALVSLNIAFQFIVIVMVYYGLSFAAGSLPGSIYINNVISGVVELVAYILTYFTLDKLGRKKLTAGPLILAGVSMILGMILTEFVKDRVCEDVENCIIDTIFKWLMHGAKFGVSATFSVIWIYAAELFPTVVRTNALSMGSMAGRIGGIITPFLTGLKTLPWLYPLVFGICCLIASGLIMLLPETAGKSMMTTIEEAEAYYKRRASTISTSISRRMSNVPRRASTGSKRASVITK